MKKYAIILLVLVFLGAALVTLWFSQDQKLDQTVFLQTTESIRNLQARDYEFAQLLPEATFNKLFDLDRLSDTNYQISEEFDNLRYDALFEEIEGSPALSTSIERFESQFFQREESLDGFIESNTAAINALLQIETINKSLHAQLSSVIPARPEISLALANKNSLVTSLLLSPEAVQISDDLNAPIATNTPALTEELNALIEEFNTAFNQLGVHYSDTLQHLGALKKLNTGPLLESIENEYINYHNQAIIGSNQFRNALLVYGGLLVLALLFFAHRIRQSYRSLEQQVADRTADIEQAYTELQESQEQLIQSEKMASLGEMVAGVAHEINTPLGYVSSNVHTLKDNLVDVAQIINKIQDLINVLNSGKREKSEVTLGISEIIQAHKSLEGVELVEESQQLIDDGTYGLGEISKLVLSLKDFARLDRQVSEQIDIHHCLENSLPIASNVIRENNITVETNFSEVPKITCMPSKLNQLFLNIITNACHAMKDKGGVLNIATALEQESIVIKFRDQGVGMDKQTQQKIFDPFFTTKEIGEGTGLGMSIAYKIVESHKGSISIDSEPQQGCEITVQLPIAA